MKKALENINGLFWLYKPYFKYGKFFALLSLLFWLIIVPICQMLTVYMPTAIIDSLENNKPFGEILLMVIIIQIILMFQPMFENVFNMFCKNSKLPYIEMKLKQEAYNKAINTDYKYIDNPEYYDNYSWAVNQYASKAQEAFSLLNRIASSLITVASMLAIITLLSPIAIAVTVIGTIIENSLHIRTNFYDVKMDEELVPYNRKIGYYHRIFYTSKYAADLKSTKISNELMYEYENVQNEKISVIKKYAKKMIGWAIGADFTFYFARTFVILNIVYGIYIGNISTVGAYVTLMLAVDKLKDSMNDMFYYIKDASRLTIYAKKIKIFFSTESKIENNKSEGIIPDKNSYEVEFKNVAFGYENSDFNIDALNFKIKKGEKVAIVGENGVGKSTLVKLLLRLYDVDSGEIRINGIDIRKYNLNDIRAQIGVAFQNANMYAISFKKNIELYNKVDKKQFNDISKRFEFDKIFKKNNADQNSVISKEFDENGIMLSGGEIQKIGIARLFAGEFGLLIFDEPSSALDPIAEYNMTKMIFDTSNRSTTIMIAHRLSTIRNADKIILIDNGKASEIGTHNELMLKKGKYYEMFVKQAENYVI